MSVKTFITINDSRWNEYKIDFVKIVNVALAMASAHDKTETIIKKSTWTIAPWMPSVMLGHAFGNVNREISIILTNDSEIRKLNKKYRGKDSPTNVLSFETGDSELLGDIFIAFDTVKRESSEFRVQSSVNNEKSELCTLNSELFVAHATHMVVHGILHLLGYDHMNDTYAAKMEMLETRILAKLGIADPYSNNVGAGSARPENIRYEWGGLTPPLLAFLCGAVASLGFAPFYFWPLSIIGIGAAYALIFASQKSMQIKDKRYEIRDKKVVKISHISYLLSFIFFGAGYAVASFWWMLHSIYVVPELAAEFAVWTVPGIIGIALAGGLIFGAPFWITHFVYRNSKLETRNSGPESRISSFEFRPIVFAAAWTFVLWLREWLLTGFPWNPFANIAMPWPALSNSMSLWGALGLTFVLIGLIVSFVEVIKGTRNQEPGTRKRLIPLAIFGSLFIVGVIYGCYNIKATAKSEIRNQKSEIIRIVQPAMEQSAKLGREQAEENVRQLVELSESSECRVQSAVNDDKNITKSDKSSELCTLHSEPSIIIWPETAYPFMIPMDEDGNALIDFSPAKELGRVVIAGVNAVQIPPSAPAFAGVTSRHNAKFFNSMIVANADGKIEKVYSKSHLVPFGEYRPFGNLIPTPGQLTSGQGPTLLSIVAAIESKEGKGKREEGRKFTFAPAICYEIIFTDSLVPTSDSRFPIPDFIVNITNDTWFGKTPGTYQHLDMARRYAIESGLPIARANYSGVSAFISADGRVISSLPVGAVGVLDGTLSGAHMTPYRKIGRDLWMVIILGFAVLVVLPWRRRKE